MSFCGCEGCVLHILAGVVVEDRIGAVRDVCRALKGAIKRADNNCVAYGKFTDDIAAVRTLLGETNLKVVQWNKKLKFRVKKLEEQVQSLQLQLEQQHQTVVELAESNGILMKRLETLNEYGKQQYSKVERLTECNKRLCEQLTEMRNERFHFRMEIGKLRRELNGDPDPSELLK